MKRKFLFLAVLSLAALIPSCGGGSGSQSNSGRTGKLTLTVLWPDRSKPSRLISTASNSIRAVLTSGSTVLGSQLIVGTDGPPNNPSTVTFNNLAAGPVTLTATGFPRTDGTGVAQTTGSVGTTIVAGQTVAVTVTMVSTIDHLEITPANPTITVGQKIVLTPTAKDAAGNVVLTPFDFQWTVNSPFLVEQPGNPSTQVTGVSAGTTTVSVKENESGKSASTNVTVTGTATGQIFVADSGNSRIVRMSDIGGTNWITLGTRGTGTNQFSTPLSIFVAADGRIYVADQTNHRIVRMNDMAGTGWTTLGTQGAGTGQFNAHPTFSWTAPTESTSRTRSTSASCGWTT